MYKLFLSSSLVGGHAATAGVAPERLHCIVVRTKRDIGGVGGPGAQVADFLARRASTGDPAKVGRGSLRMRIRHRLGIFVATHDGEAIEVAVAITIVGLVDEVLPTTR